MDAVALEDRSPLELAQGVVFVQLVVLLNKYGKDSAHMGLLTLVSGFGGNVGPLSHNGLVPSVDGT
eukprot:4753978-Prorocentrum_lima.AAC.1